MSESQDRYTFTSEIITDFSKSVASVDAFADTLENKLNKKIQQLSRDIDNIDFSIGDKLAKAVKQIEGNQIEINGASIVRKIEEALSKAITRKGFELQGIDYDKPIQVTISKRVGNTFRRKVREYFEQSAKNIEIKGATEEQTVKYSFKIPQSVFRHLQDQFEKRINTIFSQIDSSQFRWVDEGGNILKKDFKIQHTMRLEQAQKVIDFYNQKIIEQLTSPKNYVFPEPPKWDLQNVNITHFTESMRNSLDELANELNRLDGVVKSEFPTISASINKIINTINEVSTSITSALRTIEAGGEKTETAEITQAIRNIQSVKDKIVAEFNALSEIAMREIKSKPLSTLDYASVKNTFTQFEESIRNIQAKMTEAINAIAKISAKDVKIEDKAKKKPAPIQVDEATVNSLVDKVEREFNKLVRALTVTLIPSEAVGISISPAVVKHVMRQVSKYLEATISNWNPGDLLEINVKELHKDVRKILARQNEQTVKEWSRQNKMLRGEGGVEQVMRASVKAVMDNFHLAVLQNLKTGINTYITALKSVQVPSDTQAVHKLIDGLNSLQELINAKIDEIYRNQLTPYVAAVRGFRPKPPVPPHIEDKVPVSEPVGGALKTRTHGIPFIEGAGSLDFLPIGMFDRLHQAEKAALIRMENVRNRFRGRLTEAETVILDKYLKEYYKDISEAVTAHGYHDSDDKVSANVLKQAIKDAEARLRYRVEEYSARAKIDKQAEQFFDQEMRLADYAAKASLDRDKLLERYRHKLNPADYRELADALNAQVTAAEKLASRPITNKEDLERSKRELTYIKEILRQINLEYDKISKKRGLGQLIGKEGVLKGKDVITPSNVEAILKSAEALRGYEVTQVRVNNKTNQWRANIKDAEGNVRSLTGSIDRLTGSLYRHAETVSWASSRLPRMYAGINAFDRGYYGTTTLMDNDGTPINPGGDTRSFLGSVINTMRYITAGALMSTPYLALHTGWRATKEFDYQMERAKQNIMIKSAAVTFEDEAEIDGIPLKELINRIPLGEVALERTAGRYRGLDEDEFKKAVLDESRDLIKFLEKGASEVIKQIALANALNIDEAAMAYHIATRRFSDPYEAMALAQQVAKIRSIEETDVEKTAMGLEAVASQWGIGGYEMAKVANMLIVAANISQATVEELLDTQKRSGAIFRQNLPDMTKEEALAASIGLSSLFITATARSGSEGGTFWRMVLERPFMADGRKQLEELSQMGPEYAKLDPYKIDPKTGKKVNKDYIEVLSAIIEASLQMEDRGKYDLLKNLFTRWHRGSAGAVMAAITDMSVRYEKLRSALIIGGGVTPEEMEEMSVQDVIMAYIDSIRNATEDQVRLMQAGIMDTWKFRTQRVSTMWQVSSEGIFEELKDEFNELSLALSVFLRQVRDNAGQVAEAMTMLSKVAFIAISEYIGTRVARWGDRKEVEYRASQVDRVRQILDQEGKALNLRRILLEDEYMHYARRGERASVGRENIQSKLDEAIYQRAQLIEQLGKPGVDRRRVQKEIESKDKHITNLQKGLQNVDTIDAESATRLRELEKEMQITAKSAVELDNRMRLLNEAARHLGVGGGKLQSEMRLVGDGFRNSSVFAEMYSKELREASTQSGMATEELKKLRSELDRLNAEFKSGQIDAQRYSRELQKLESRHLAGTHGIAGGTGTGLGESGLLQAVLGGTIAGGIIKGGSIKDTLKTGAGGLGRAAKHGILGLFRRFPHIIAAILAMNAFQVVSNPLFSRAMTEAERLQSEAAKRESAIQKLLNIDNADNFIAREFYKLAYLVDSLFGGIANILGGTTLSFAESLGAYKDIFTKSGEELEKALQDRLMMVEDEQGNLIDRRVHANIKQYEEDLPKLPGDLDGDGLLDISIDKGSMLLSVDDATAVINQFKETLEKEITRSQMETEIQRMQYLLRGYSESSEELRELLNKHYEKSIEALDLAIKGLREYAEAAMEGPAKDAMEAQIREYEAQRARLEFDRYMNEYGRVGAILDTMNKNIQMIEAKSSVRKSQAIIGGHTEDSTLMKALRKSEAEDKIAEMKEAQLRLTEMLTNYVDKPEQYSEIMLNIQRLEAQQKQLLADIYRDMIKESSSFNLPPGIQPMTYWEAMTAGSTHRNITVRSGDVIVNVTVDNMTGDYEAAQRLASTIGASVREQQAAISRELSQQVRTGMGTGYFSTIGSY